MAKTTSSEELLRDIDAAISRIEAQQVTSKGDQVELGEQLEEQMQARREVEEQMQARREVEEQRAK